MYEHPTRSGSTFARKVHGDLKLSFDMREGQAVQRQMPIKQKNGLSGPVGDALQYIVSPA